MEKYGWLVYSKEFLETKRSKLEDSRLETWSWKKKLEARSSWK